MALESLRRKTGKTWIFEVRFIQNDQFLKEKAPESRTHDWESLSGLFSERFPNNPKSSKQCRDRWINYLDPSLRSDPWTAEESKTLFYNHSLFGSKWSTLATFLPGRSENSIKNHFYSTARKNIRRYNIDLPKELQIRLGVNEMMNCPAMREVFIKPTLDKKCLAEMKRGLEMHLEEKVKIDWRIRKARLMQRVLYEGMLNNLKGLCEAFFKFEETFIEEHSLNL